MDCHNDCHKWAHSEEKAATTRTVSAAGNTSSALMRHFVRQHQSWPQCNFGGLCLKKKKKAENKRTQCELRTLSGLMWRNTSNTLPHWGRSRAKDNASMGSLGAGWVAACVGCVGKTGFGSGQEEITFQRAVSPLQGNWGVINFWVHQPSGFSQRQDFKN